VALRAYQLRRFHPTNRRWLDVRVLHDLDEVAWLSK